MASPDGSTVAVAGKKGEIVTMDVSTGARAAIHQPRRQVSRLDYSEDGAGLRLRRRRGQPLGRHDAGPAGHRVPTSQGDPVPAGAQFIGDSHDVAIASYDGGVYRWETDLDRAVDFACQMAGRDLTREEWAEFLPAQPYRSVCPDK